MKAIIEKLPSHKGDITMSRSMQDVVKEYNQFTGQSIKRFATIEIGEKRLMLAKASKPVPEPKIRCTIASVAKCGKQRITVDGHPHRSVYTAFIELGLPTGKHIKFRKKLRASEDEIFEHEGRSYHFTIIKQESLLLENRGNK